VIVAIEAASSQLSVSLAEPGGASIASTAWSSDARQSAELLPRLLTLLTDGGRRVTDISAVAVGTGPGSFTGLRVAMSLGKGLCVALRVPILGVPSLDAWLDADPDATAALSRAGAQEAYLLELGADDVRIADRATLRERIAGRPVAAPEDLARAFAIDDARPPVGAAAAIARRAAKRIAQGMRDDLESIEPRYLRAPRGVAVETPGAVRWL
jgi:tRNA threonylcarbamoyladenosine biosynthesis protein TsaB